MKKNLKYLLILGLGFSTLTSCDLDLFPESSVTYNDGEPMIHSIGDVNKLRNGMHQSFRVAQYGQITMAPEFMCDGFNATLDYGNNYGSIHRLDAGFTASDYEVRDMWALNYFGIKNYNLFIEHIANYEAKAAEKEVVNVATGEAHFYRAAAYLQLVRHFAKLYEPGTARQDKAVPLVLTYNKEDKPAQASVEEVYEQIKADLDIAAEKLAAVKGKVGSTTPTIDVVNALYARYYLDKRDWSNAASYAEKVIASAAGYALSETKEQMEQEYINDNGKEAIMRLPATLTESGSQEPFDGVGNNVVNNLYTRATSSNTYGLHYVPYYIPSKKLVDLYEADDLRFKQWFRNDLKVVINGAIWTGEFYIFTKYHGNPALRNNTIPNARQKVKPFLISEMYLIAAEAYWNDGKNEESKAKLNELQQKRGATETEATPENIKNEWFKETVGEGMRMICLKRWKDGYNGRPCQEGAEDAVINTNDNYCNKVVDHRAKFWTWPIPARELKVNANLEQHAEWLDI